MAIIIEDVSLNLGGKLILERFSLQLPDSGVVCLCGPSGCGKTTLLHLLAGLHQPQSGAMQGLDAKRMAMVFQEDRLLPWLNAAGNVALVLPGQGGEEKSTPWLELVELTEEAAKYPGTLSGGMRRRVALARALAYDGDVLLLDEPTNGLDSDLARRVMERIKELYAGRLVVLVTHDRDFAAEHADVLIELTGPPLKSNSASCLAAGR